MFIRHQTEASVLLEAKRFIGIIGGLGKLPKPFGALDLTKLVRGLEEAITTAAEAKTARVRAVAAKQRLLREVRLYLSQVRAAVKGIYGPDSAEYVDVGGTRSSEHKRFMRRPGPGAQTSSAAPTVQ